MKMCEDLFERLESVLLGEDRKCLDEIKKQFYQNIELWHADIEILEEYYKDQEKENEVLMIEISQSNDQIKQLREQLAQTTGKVEDSDRLLSILKRNDERLIKLKEKAAIPAGAAVRATLRLICAYGASGSGKLEDYGSIISSV